MITGNGLHSIASMAHRQIEYSVKTGSRGSFSRFDDPQQTA